MKKPLKSFRFAAILLLIVFGTSSFTYRFGQGPLDGKWVENWGDGQKTDVTYHDVFIIHQKAQGGLSISCSTHTYQFDEIHFDGHILSFVKHNGTYQIPYRLKLSPDLKLLLGSAINIHKVSDRIRWTRKP